MGSEQFSCSEGLAMITKKQILLVLRIILGGIFVYASIDKIFHPAAFAEMIYNYQILPDVFINLSALVLPWLELCIGVCLISGKWMPGAAFLLNVLLIIFFAALLFNLYRGININCGCFSTSAKPSESGSMITDVIRDAVFLAMAIYLFIQTYIENRRRAE
jgi:uncharacterized membrane protein YphA (DoxX/SURF4 family)